MGWGGGKRRGGEEGERREKGRIGESFGEWNG